MAPNTKNECTGVLDEQDIETEDGGLQADIQALKVAGDRKIEIVWRSVFVLGITHIAALYGAYLFITAAKWSTVVFTIALYFANNFGMTAGSHRLWSHRSYKAKLPLRIILMLCQTMTFQLNVIHWARDHRVHHKYSETDADPHNANRGFFFSHYGWLLCRKHPDVIEKGKVIDIQ